MKSSLSQRAFLIAGIAMCFIATTNAHAEERIIDKTFAVTKGGALTVSSDYGAIAVTGSDRNDVVIHVVVRGDRHFVDDFQFSADSTANGVAIRGRRFDDNWFGLTWFSRMDTEVSYTIQVPRDIQVKVNNSRGDLNFRDFNGKAYGHTSRGDVTAAGINGVVQIDTSRGNVRVSRLVGNISIVTSRGDVELKNVMGPVDVQASRGSISAEIANPNGGITLQTSRGDVSISVPAQFAADLDARTSRGDIACDLPINGKVHSTDKYNGTLRGSINGGGKPLKVETSRGSIEIRTAL